MPEVYLDPRKKILSKLFLHRYIGGKHTEVRNILKGFPQEKHDEIQQIIKDLNNEGLLLIYPKTNQMHCSLNPATLNYVKQELGII
ncbi:hypothetical protein HY988_03910 [Candidatus Micrarchaeota archaeon]|nr:hypothetical protein [Candidatus Micrarchaeota archaeon]